MFGVKVQKGKVKKMSAADRQVQDSISVLICIALVFKLHRFISNDNNQIYLLKTLSDCTQDSTQ